MIKVRQESVRLSQEHLKQVQIKVGTVALADKLVSEVQIANEMQSIIRIRSNYNKAVETLIFLEAVGKIR